MSEGPLDEQIRQAFSALTSPPRPQLDDRIRDSIWSRPATTRSLPLPPALAVLVAALLVLALVAAVFEGPAAIRTAGMVGRGLNGTIARALTPARTAATPAHQATATPRATPTPAPTASATASATPAPTEAPTATPAPTPPPPTAPVATLPGFSCDTQTGGGGESTMATARVGAQSGYDRFVIQFSGPVPQFEVTLQSSASFAQGGTPVTLRGGAGIQVVLHNASGAGAYSGPSDVTPAFPEIQEARLISDGQGTVQWGVGLAHAACFHAWVLPSPSRLVVDIAT